MMEKQAQRKQTWVDEAQRPGLQSAEVCILCFHLKKHRPVATWFHLSPKNHDKNKQSWAESLSCSCVSRF